MLGLSWRSTRDILQGEQLPQLGTLLRICYCLGLAPLHLLTEESINIDSIQLDVQQAPQFQRRPKMHIRPFDADYVCHILDTELANDKTPPRSMREVAKSLGYDQSFLTKHFPKRCKSISARRRHHLKTMKTERITRIHTEVRQATYTINDLGLYPSEKRITPLLSKPWYMSEPGAREVWHQTLKKLGWEP